MTRREIEQRIANQVLFAMARASGMLPLSMLETLGARLGDLTYHISPRHRRLVMEQLRQCFGAEKRPEELMAIARAFYRNVGRNLLEFLHLPQMDEEAVKRLVRLEGKEHMMRALERGKGVILLTAHYGNWELIGARMTAEGYPLNVIARDQADPRVTRLALSVRRSQGMTVIARDRGLRHIVRLLHQNEIVGFLLDQNAARHGVFVEFFGRLASTHGGAAGLAMLTGAAVVPTFGIRHPDNTHTCLHLPAMEIVSTGDRDADIVANTAAMTRVIEAEIRKRPDHWFWLHRRWKTRPPWERADQGHASVRMRRLHAREK